MPKTHDQFIIGIDEAGRGPLAGPVAVGAFAVKSMAALKKFRGVKDSKQLSEKQREEWFVRISKEAKKQKANVFYAVSYSRSSTIDGRGLSRAVYSAVNRCLKKLEKKHSIHPNSVVLLDGSLYASPKYVNQKTIIGGDESQSIIALASICAKVIRDRKMKRLAREYPEYGFEIHKGYGTREHYRAIKKHGVSPIHRTSFLENIRK